ncbi:hypothetical protein ACQZV8_13300 [Magnetococcales bacterium HHB-1]
MISLSTCKEPYEIELPYETTVTVRPLTSNDMITAQSAARQRLESIEKSRDDESKAGFKPESGFPDLKKPEERESFFQSLLTKELAMRHIISWDGVIGPDGRSNATINEQNIATLMDIYPIGERFFEAFTMKQVLLNAAKNCLGFSAESSLSGVEIRDIADGVKRMVPRAHLDLL